MQKPEGVVEPAATQPETHTYKVKVLVCPHVNEIDESVVFLYHLFLNSAHAQGVDYQEPFGDWVRSSAFRFHMEHLEPINFSTMLKREGRRDLVRAS